MSGRARLPNSVHMSYPWRIHEIAADFRLEDVWALPVRGEQSDFPQLVASMVDGDPSQSSWPVHALWAIRWKLGELLGWDAAETGLGARVPTLRERLPKDLLDAPRPEFDTLPFTSLYLLEDEFAAEIANQTVHGIMHLGWVAEESGGYRGQMAVYVRPNGLLGNAYMAAIKPFRHLFVYPQMLGEMERRWGSRDRRAAADARPSSPGAPGHV
jgi:hypothetical protein